MAIITSQRSASLIEVVTEMDRRGKVIEQLERQRDEALERLATTIDQLIAANRQRDLAEIKRADTERGITAVEDEARIAERARIAAALDDEAEVTPCAEDASVVRRCAGLVKANFSCDDAE